MTPDQQLRQETLASLTRAQDFDPATLVRQDEFGKALNFADAVAPAQRLVDLYKRLTATALEDFPAEQLNVVKNAANRDFALFAQILNLDPKQGISPATRNSLVTAIEQAYQPTFRELYPLIAFSLHRAASLICCRRFPARMLRQEDGPWTSREPTKINSWSRGRRMGMPVRSTIWW